ncbi:MAG: SEC-C metal-binding domain-containing protein [Acidimicrobiia bacterium]
MTLSRQVLRKIDDALRSELDQETGEWMAKVPISGATKVVWQRYCQAVGVGMGEVAGEDAETLADRRNARDEELTDRVQELKDREKNLRQRERAMSLREADIEDREKDVAAREQNVATIEENLAQKLRVSSRPQTAGSSKPKLGRNEACWCKSGKKYKNCHLIPDQSR